MVPDIHVICLESKFTERGAVTLAFLASNIDKHLYRTLNKFTAVTPSDFVVEDKASVRQLTIIKGRKGRIEHADMSSRAQVACALSHMALWKLCADTNQPIVVVEDDVRPRNMSERLKQASGLKGDVVLLSCANLVRNDQTKHVSSFSGTGSYLITPRGARTLLKHAHPVSMHVDYYMSTCIAAYNLNVMAVDNARGQWDMPSSKLSTLEHTKFVFDIQVPCLELVSLMLSLVLALCVLIFLGCGVAMMCTWRRKHNPH